jgi:hypothetical protein
MVGLWIKLLSQILGRVAQPVKPVHFKFVQRCLPPFILQGRDG